MAKLQRSWVNSSVQCHTEKQQRKIIKGYKEIVKPSKEMTQWLKVLVCMQSLTAPSVNSQNFPMPSSAIIIPFLKYNKKVTFSKIYTPCLAVFTFLSSFLTTLLCFLPATDERSDERVLGSSLAPQWDLFQICLPMISRPKYNQDNPSSNDIQPSNCSKLQDFQVSPALIFALNPSKN